MAGQAAVGGLALPDGRDFSSDAGGDDHGRKGGDAEQEHGRVHRRQNTHDDDESERDAERAEERQEDVVEREHLVAQHGETVEHLGSLVLLDADGGGLQSGDVGLEGDGEPLAETIVQPLASCGHHPAADGGEGHADGGDHQERPIGLAWGTQRFGDEAQPQRDECIGQRTQSCRAE